MCYNKMRKPGDFFLNKQNIGKATLVVLAFLAAGGIIFNQYTIQKKVDLVDSKANYVLSKVETTEATPSATSTPSAQTSKARPVKL